MAYTTQENVEDALGRSLTTAEASHLLLILAFVDSWIDSVLDGSYEDVEESTKYYDGSGAILDIDECNSITAVTIVDDEEDVSYTYTLDEDFEARPRNETNKRWIELRDGVFPKGVGNIAVTAKFTLGTEAPDDIVYLATYLSSQLIKHGPHSDIKKESIEGYSREFTEMTMDNEITKNILDKYVKDDVLIC